MILLQHQQIVALAKLGRAIPITKGDVQVLEALFAACGQHLKAFSIPLVAADVERPKEPA